MRLVPPTLARTLPRTLAVARCFHRDRHGLLSICSPSIVSRPKVSAIVDGGKAKRRPRFLVSRHHLGLKEFPKNEISRIEPLNLGICEPWPASAVIFVSSSSSSFVPRPRAVSIVSRFEDEDEGRRTRRRHLGSWGGHSSMPTLNFCKGIAGFGFGLICLPSHSTRGNQRVRLGPNGEGRLLVCPRLKI